MPRFDLNVDFSEKEYAKSFGAKFDWNNRVWYYEGQKVPRGLAIFYMGPGENVEGYGEGPGEGTANRTGGTVAGARTGARAGGTASGARTRTGVGTGQRTGSTQEYSATGNPEEDRMLNGIRLSSYKTVSEFQGNVADLFNTPEYYQAAIRGEVANFDKADSKGNYWFDLKDKESGSLLHCVVWATNTHIMPDIEKMREKPEIAVIGKFKWFEKSGSATLLINKMADIGEGASNLALLQLIQRLEEEGLFDPIHHKKDDEFPKYPKCIGVVTSKSGKAIQDISINALQYTQICLYHAQVQSLSNIEGIVDEMINGIKVLDDMKEVEVIILGRGGDSNETLMNVYNNERLIRAVFECKTPIISAVGHEGDDPLLDRVADKAFNAPSTAAIFVVQHLKRQVDTLENYRNSFELLMKNRISRSHLELNRKVNELNLHSPEKKIMEKKSQISGYIQSFGSSLQYQVSDYRRKLEYYKSGIVHAPQGLLVQNKSRLDIQKQNLKIFANALYDTRRNQYMLAVKELNGLSPTAKLINGFGYISQNDNPISSVKDINQGDEIQVTIHDGVITADVKNIERKEV